MELKQKIAYNTVVQIIGKALSTLLGVISLAIMTRYLKTTGFGEYSTIINFVSFFAMSADLGLTLISAQMISNPNENQNKMLSNLFSLRLVSALLLLGLAPLTVMFFPYSPIIKIGVLIATISYLFPALNQIIIALFQKTLKMERAMLAEVGGKVFLVIAMFIAIKIDSGLNGILWVSVFSAGVGFILNWFLSKKEAKIKLEFDFTVWKKILKKTWPLATTIILNLIYQKGDIITLSLFKDVTDVGIYGAAYRTIEVIGTIPYMFAGVMLPLFTLNWINKNFSFFEKLIQKSFNFMIVLAVPLIIGAQFTATEVIKLIAGDDFANGGLPLQILMISIALLFVSCIFSHVIIAIDKQKKVILLYLITAISSLILYLILIPKMSYLGASLVTIYSNLIILIGSLFYTKKFTKIKLNYKIFKPVFLASLGMATFMFILPRFLYQNGVLLLSIIILSILIYFLLLYLFKGISKEDLKIFTRKSA
jgi:O-antigen/teichoic acid export membrane protein